MSDFVGDTIEEISRAVLETVVGSPELQGRFVAETYHRMLEAVVHPANADAVRHLRSIAALGRTDAHDPMLRNLALDALAALEFLGLTPDPDARERVRARGEAPLLDKIREKVRPLVENAVAADLEDMPVAGRPN